MKHVLIAPAQRHLAQPFRKHPNARLDRYIEDCHYTESYFLSTACQSENLRHSSLRDHHDHRMRVTHRLARDDSSIHNELRTEKAVRVSVAPLNGMEMYGTYQVVRIPDLGIRVDNAA